MKKNTAIITKAEQAQFKALSNNMDGLVSGGSIKQAVDILSKQEKLLKQQDKQMAGVVKQIDGMHNRLMSMGRSTDKVLASAVQSRDRILREHDKLVQEVAQGSDRSEDGRRSVLKEIRRETDAELNDLRSDLRRLGAGDIYSNDLSLAAISSRRMTSTEVEVAKGMIPAAKRVESATKSVIPVISDMLNNTFATVRRLEKSMASASAIASSGVKDAKTGLQSMSTLRKKLLAFSAHMLRLKSKYLKLGSKLRDLIKGLDGARNTARISFHIWFTANMVKMVGLILFFAAGLSLVGGVIVLAASVVTHIAKWVTIWRHLRNLWDKSDVQTA